MSSGIPRILYVNDFAPSDIGAGPLQLLRLLSCHDPGRLLLICAGKQLGDLDRTVLATSKKIVLPQLAGRRIHGWRRLLPLLDRLTLPFLSVFVAVTTFLWKPAAIVSVAHGYYFLAGALAASLMNTRFVLIVHDDWVALSRMEVYLFRRTADRLFRFALRKATAVLAVSESMARHLKTKYDIESVVFYPCARRNPGSETAPGHRNAESVQLIFCGHISHTVEDAIGALAACLNTPTLHARIGKEVQFTIYSRFPRSVMEQRGWLSQHVTTREWVPREELDRSIAGSDIMILPLGFAESAAFYSATSFPSKVADYLAAGKPILVVGPAESPVVQYMQNQQYAIVVDAPDPIRLSQVLHDLVVDPERLRVMSDAAIQAFRIHHDVENARRFLYQYLEGSVTCEMEGAA